MTNDLFTWQTGLSLLTREWETLPFHTRERIAQLIREIMLCREEIHRIVSGVGGEEICASCKGLCCTRGKYHVAPVDLLAFIVTGRPLFTPDFENGACPYLGEGGCLIPPAYRPYPCITFACEAIDERIEPLERRRLHFLTDNLRSLYREVDDILGKRTSGGLLHHAERHLTDGGGILLP